MEKIMIKNYEEPELNSPIFVGGLPGIGNVGKIAADYFVEKLKMEKMADIYSEFLPPQVFISNNVVHLVRESLYYKKTGRKNDLIFPLFFSSSIFILYFWNLSAGEYFIGIAITVAAPQ